MISWRSSSPSFLCGFKDNYPCLTVRINLCFQIRLKALTGYESDESQSGSVHKPSTKEAQVCLCV